MDVTVDVGENTRKVFEQLAEQIGVTIKDLFPWYVNQFYLEGIIVLGILTLLLLVAGTTFIWGMSKATWRDDAYYEVISIISGLVILVVITASVAHGPGYVTYVFNPQYHAAKELIKDASKLIHK